MARTSTTLPAGIQTDPWNDLKNAGKLRSTKTTAPVGTPLGRQQARKGPSEIEI